jgi:hypothetical protein
LAAAKTIAPLPRATPFVPSLFSIGSNRPRH